MPACPGVAGVPVAVVAAPGAIAYAVDPSAVYWSDGRKLWTAGHDGSGTRDLPLAATAKSDVTALEVRDGELWIALAKWKKKKCEGELVVMTLADGKTRRLEPVGCARDIALDDEWVHWTEETAFPDPGGLASNLHGARRKGGASVTRARMINGVTSVASDGRFIYFVLEIGAALRRMAIDGGETADLVQGKRIDEVYNAIDEDAFAVDDAHVYFLHGHPNFEPGRRVLRVPKAGGVPENLAQAHVGRMNGQGLMQGKLALDATHVYWTSPAEGEVRRTDKAGKCGAQVVAAERGAPDHVRVLGRTLYWLETNAEGRAIARLAL